MLEITGINGNKTHWKPLLHWNFTQSEMLGKTASASIVKKIIFRPYK